MVKILLIFLTIFAINNFCSAESDPVKIKTPHKDFFIFEEEKNWFGAVNKCKQEGWELTSIDNKKEYDVLRDYASNKKGSIKLWIGANNLESNNLEDFHWISNGEALDFQVWVTGEPNNFENSESCVDIGPYGFNDNQCSRLFPFICSKEK